MDEVAEALDLMNEKYGIQHLDIKPQNLFLVQNHIKVADFGLAKDMNGKAAVTITGGVTPVYAAPETFDGWLSRASDQYSLAIVYQEILTGHRPFTGSTMRQLVLQHLQMAPDLSSLPVADRPIIGRALNKNHEQRYPSCTDLVKALRVATGSSARPLPGAANPPDEAAASTGPKEPLSAAPDTGHESQLTQGKGAKSPRSAPAGASNGGAPSLEDRPQVLPPRPGFKPRRTSDTPALSEAVGGTIPKAGMGKSHHGSRGIASAPGRDDFAQRRLAAGAGARTRPAGVGNAAPASQAGGARIRPGRCLAACAPPGHRHRSGGHPGGRPR